MRIPGKLSIVVPDGYIAYTAEQTRQRSYPIVIVPQGTPVEKADRTPQRLDVFMYISNKNAEKIVIDFVKITKDGHKLKT